MTGVRTGLACPTPPNTGHPGLGLQALPSPHGTPRLDTRACRTPSSTASGRLAHPHTIPRPGQRTHRTVDLPPEPRLSLPPPPVSHPPGGEVAALPSGPPPCTGTPGGDGGFGPRGGGGGLAGTPLLPGSSYGPRRRRPKICKPKSSWHRRRRSKILDVSLKHWKGRRGRGGGSRGGGSPLLRCTAVLMHPFGGGGLRGGGGLTLVLANRTPKHIRRQR